MKPLEIIDTLLHEKIEEKKFVFSLCVHDQENRELWKTYNDLRSEISCLYDVRAVFILQGYKICNQD